MNTVRSIVILGAGELGGALARQIAAADITRRVVLVDEAGTVAAGKALDVQQAAPVDGYTTEVMGTRDEAAVVGADAIVIADRFQSSSEWQDDAGVALVQRVAYLNPSAPVLCAGARQLEVVERSIREAGLSPARRHRLGAGGTPFRRDCDDGPRGALQPERSVVDRGRPAPGRDDRALGRRIDWGPSRV